MAWIRDLVLMRARTLEVSTSCSTGAIAVRVPAAPGGEA